MSGLLRISFLLGLVAKALAQAGPSQWNPSPFNPPALPLAVKGPYMNTWMPQGNNPAEISSFWPNLWTINDITGWYASVVVDGTAYRIIGDAPITGAPGANQTGVEFTPTRTSFTFVTGPMTINATFLSPVTPTDLVRQSMPISYFYMTAESNDGNPHDLKMYSDISAEWISGDDSQIVTWTTDTSGDYIVLQAQLQSPLSFTEKRDHAQDATEFYCMKNIPGTSWQLSQDVATRTAFANGTLSNSADSSSQFRAVSSNWPVLGIAMDFGSVTSTPAPAVWTLGIVRDPVVQYSNNGQNELRSSYYISAFDSVEDAIKMAIDDFDNALSAAIAMDAKVIADGQKYSQNYANLLTLTLRQAMGAIDITLVKEVDGNWNSTNIKAFMKNMGSVGSTGGVNSVDAIYAAFPVYLYLNPEIGGYLLAPLLEYQDSSQYKLPYAAQDIGSTYPNATADGLNTPHNYGIEETANMLIMTLAHAQASGNGTLISKHYTLLRSWADYLTNTTLAPNSQLLPDKNGLSTTNDTNLALKGIIGISAMSKISTYANVKDDVTKYENTASSYIKQWQSLATASDSSHMLMTYGQQDTSGLLYNLYADKLLQLNLVPDEVYSIQTVFYNNQAPSNKYGLALDSADPHQSRTDWMIYSAAIVDVQATRDFLVQQVELYASPNLNNTPFGAYYDPATGQSNSGQNSPVQGGLFAFLALNQTIKTVTIPSGASTIPGSSSSHKSNVGAIAGGVIGGLIGLGVIGGGIFYFFRRRPSQWDSEIADKIKSSGRPVGFTHSGSFEPFSDAPRGQTPSLGYTHNSSSGPSADMSYNPQSQNGSALDNAYRPIINGARDSAYFGSAPHTDASESDIGPSASQVGSVMSSGVGSQSRLGVPAPRQVMVAKQTLLNEELRSEMDNLRRDLDRIRLERGLDEAPPQYTEPV